MLTSPRFLRIGILAFLAVGLIGVAVGAHAQRAGDATEELPVPATAASYEWDEVVASGCYTDPSIIYRERLRAKWYYGCEPGVDAMLTVQHPGSCECTVNVPVCLPACLEGVPVICSRCKPSGRGVVNYRWCNGFHVKIVFRKRGDIVVTYMPIFS